LPTVHNEGKNAMTSSVYQNPSLTYNTSTALLTTKKPVTFVTGFTCSGNWTPFDYAQDKPGQ